MSRWIDRSLLLLDFMHSAAPRLSLSMLLLVAAALPVGGFLFSRREVTVREERDLRPLRQYAAELQNDLNALEQTYERHLSELAAQVSPDDRIAVANACDAISGVEQCSFLYRGGGMAEVHVRGVGVPLGKYSIPTFSTPSQVKPEDFTPLSPESYFDQSASDHGWSELPGRPLYFWRLRHPTLMVALTIDPAIVRGTVQSWLTQWRESHPLPPSSARQALLSADTPDTESQAPDWEQPLTSRFGGWRLVSWDARRTEVHRDRSTLVAATTLAFLLAGMAVFIHAQQRRAWRQAQQRVSFVNSVSHELRTPLTNMLLNLDLVAESLGEEEPDSARRLALVREEAGRLSRLIENVLSFTRKEQGNAPPLRPSACHPAQVVDAVLAQFGPALQRRGITVTRQHEGADDDAGLDSDALSQIVANLLSNVEKYAAGVPARVNTLQSAESFVLRVHDGGPGIPQKAAESVFEPFTRLQDAVSEGASGTGLGLAIARDLATRLGGSLELDPSERGACFVLRLPWSPL